MALWHFYKKRSVLQQIQRNNITQVDKIKSTKISKEMSKTSLLASNNNTNVYKVKTNFTTITVSLSTIHCSSI